MTAANPDAGASPLKSGLPTRRRVSSKGRVAQGRNRPNLNPKGSSERIQANRQHRETKNTKTACQRQEQGKEECMPVGDRAKDSKWQKEDNIRTS